MLGQGGSWVELKSTWYELYSRLGHTVPLKCCSIVVAVIVVVPCVVVACPSAPGVV
jgi:hypothetical protein